MGAIANQIGPTSAVTPYVQQMNFAQMIGQLLSYNPNFSSSQADVTLNSIVRKVYDRRLWYGLMVKGQIVTPGTTTGGTIALTLGSASVVGTGTAFTASMIGQSLRVGFINPIYNIINVDVTNQVLTLELPWGSPSVSATGYFITQYYYSFPNLNYFYSVKNLQLMYRLWTNLTQAFLDNVDPSRMQLIYPKVVAQMPPDTNGNYQVELWPASQIQQALPYLAYVQPPNLVNDGDSLPPYIRADIVVAHGIADALMWRPKDNSFYSESSAMTIASAKMKEFESELVRMEWQDENRYRQDCLNFAETLHLQT